GHTVRGAPAGDRGDIELPPLQINADDVNVEVIPITKTRDFSVIEPIRDTLPVDVTLAVRAVFLFFVLLAPRRTQLSKSGRRDKQQERDECFAHAVAPRNGCAV